MKINLNNYITSCCIGKTTRSRSHFSAEQGVSEPSSINQNNFRPIFVPLKTILNDKDLKPMKSPKVQTPSVIQNSKS